MYWLILLPLKDTPLEWWILCLRRSTGTHVRRKKTEPTGSVSQAVVREALKRAVRCVATKYCCLSY